MHEEKHSHFACNVAPRQNVEANNSSEADISQ